MKPAGRKEVAEAVLIALLSALAAQAVNIGVDAIKSAVARRKEAKAQEGAATGGT